LFQLDYSFPDFESAFALLKEKGADDFLFEASGVIMVRRLQAIEVAVKPSEEYLASYSIINPTGNLSFFNGKAISEGGNWYVAFYKGMMDQGRLDR
jgi:hypothetical protein